MPIRKVAGGWKWGSKGPFKTRAKAVAVAQAAYAHGYKKLSVEEGINSARLLIPRCWFDADKCKDGLEALRQYRKEYDEKLKTFKLRPLHDWASHGADAFRYLALSVDKFTAQKKLAPIKYSNAGIV